MSLHPYDVYIHESLLSCTPRSGRSRRRIMDFVRSLAADPFQHGDYVESDPSGHPTSITLIDRYAVTFFVDHAMREIKIVNIQPADEG